MTSLMVNQDLDSTLITALRLLHSPDSDSENQLRQLWKQSVFEKYGNSRVPTSVLHKIQLPSTTSKRNKENDDDADVVVESKKMKIELVNCFSKSSASPSHRSLTSTPAKTYDISSDSDAESDFVEAVEIYSGDGMCVKCKTSFSSTNNKLVECVDCHKHYHQDCHFPPIADMDLNDPRLVWYCFACEENISATNLKEKIKNSEFSSPSKSVSPLKNNRSNFSGKPTGSSSGSSSKPDSSPKHSSTSSKKHGTSKKGDKKKLVK